MSVKSLLFVLLLAVFPGKGFAVGGYGGNPGNGIGFLGGFRYNSMVIPNDQSYNRTLRSTPNYQTGIVLYFPVTDTVSLRLGALYAVRDMDFSTPINSPTSNGRAHLTYIDLPASLQMSLGPNFYVWFGQMLGVKVSDVCDVGGGTNNCTSPAAPVDISSVAGFGWNAIELGGSGKISIEAEYEYGMNNIFPAFQTNTAAIIGNMIIRFNL